MDVTEARELLRTGERCDVQEVAGWALDQLEPLSKQRDALVKACKVQSDKLLSLGRASWNDADISYAMELVKAGPVEIDRLCSKLHEQRMTIQELREQIEWRPVSTYVPGPVPESGLEWDRDPVEVWDGELQVAYWTSREGWINARDRAYDEAERLTGVTHWRPLRPGPDPRS